mmetsp:Transcript_31820/g.48813  ORF Transcript_31820/g.48813 Transcript_31820/m.48813 type:complete len:96 (-) Transcript_31820:434-721(-)|eukprot:CAMPEP_0170485730 /NCGR_PEP_ID=MMETSP0208-20121228/4917_1 /TAXON_ID=197538 /ORGANISM="Strombidium inclinatum, Strain S3" /LENGTH=95 /DNA_ID=CAMNT_0010759455 /DNA_START=599 /DNA_END=886 /DNA_ORIENTATION=+
MFFGDQIMADLKEDFWWILGSQGVIAVLAVPWIFIKLGFGFLVGMYLLLGVEAENDWEIFLMYVIYIVGGAILIEMLIFDGPLAALGQNSIWEIT